jgi:hypothetical protein
MEIVIKPALYVEDVLDTPARRFPARIRGTKKHILTYAWGKCYSDALDHCLFSLCKHEETGDRRWLERYRDGVAMYAEVFFEKFYIKYLIDCRGNLWSLKDTYPEALPMLPPRYRHE